MSARGGRLGLLVVALLAAFAAGCGTDVTPHAGPTSPPDSTTAASVGGAGGPSASATPGGDLVLEFAGDVHFTGRTAALLGDPATAFGSISAVLSDADVTMVNLETAITGRGAAQPKTFHFRGPPEAFDAVRAAGIDLVTVANNHILDYGRVGLTDTLAAAQAKNFPIVGAGADADAAWAPHIVTVRGTRIAYIGVSDVQELAAQWIATPSRSGVAIANDLTRTVAAVKAAKRQADIVVVFMHWGTEGVSCPDSMQKTLAKQLADAGADIIIGSHAHTLQGSGWLGHTFVAFGMANFLWYGNSYSTQTGVLRLIIPAGAHVPTTAQLIPAVVSGTGQPVVATGATAKSILERYDSIRACAGLSASPPSRP